MTTPSEIYSPGLEGVIAGETAISTVVGGLRYRGYPVVELAEKSTFDEVAFLLLHGELPTRAQLADFNKRLAAAQKLPSVLSELLTKLPKNAVPMDVLRTGVSILAHYEPELEDGSRAANLRKAERLLAQIPLIIAEYYRAAKGQALVRSKPELGFAANMMYMLKGTPPSTADARAFDVSLILYAEHEFNASTFTARVVCSTESDLHASVTAAIGALKGRLHGGANEKVMDMLLATGGPDKAEAWIRAALARKDKVMGFGHRVYKLGDVRAKVLKEYASPGGPTHRHDAMGGRGRHHRKGARRREKPVPESRLARGSALSRPRSGSAALYAVLRGVARHRLVRPCHRATGAQSAHPSARPLHWAGGKARDADRGTGLEHRMQPTRNLLCVRTVFPSSSA